MKVVIPLAGKGTRLRPHTHITPKPMLKIAGKPVTLFELPARAEKTSFLQYWRQRRRRRFALGKGWDPVDRLYDAGIRRGWIRPGRDVPTLLTWLKRTGGVSGDPQAAPRMAARLQAERDEVLDRLHRLLAPGA